MTTATSAIAETYERDGFVFPIDIVSEAEAKEIRADLEAGEKELADRPDELSMLHSYPDRLLPSFDKLIRNQKLIAAASQILGPDLMVWSSGLFIKEANTPSYVTWHQDLTYWGLDDAEEVTAWFALSHSNIESGCMRFVPGSQKKQLVPHVDSFAEGNLLSRGQEVAVEVDDADAVDVILKPGQASFHHGHLFHASGPNKTGDRRIGAAIRYIKPSMKQRSGDKSVVAHVAGEDRYGNFTVADAPKGRLLESNFALCRTDMAIKSRVLYEGAEQSGGKRYRQER
ncbi:MAG: phytanoyl-CoA dioxygenase family protein [Alphaproteobacteria bacterium]|nr:phytanoyl-CoA dioxygenase family protein [Alphaproteobacteria bacterium]